MSGITLERVDHLSDALIDQLADVMRIALRDLPVSYPTPEAARQELTLFNDDDRFVLVARDHGEVGGFIGAVMHSEFMWELHPLCVRPDLQRQGVGRALVGALEREAMNAGVVTIWLGTEDEIGATTLFGVDISGEPLRHLSEMQLHQRHPIAFYRKLGYNVCGVLPDASGPGKHDFLMSKRLPPRPR